MRLFFFYLIFEIRLIKFKVKKLKFIMDVNSKYFYKLNSKLNLNILNSYLE